MTRLLREIGKWTTLALITIGMALSLGSQPWAATLPATPAAIAVATPASTCEAPLRSFDDMQVLIATPVAGLPFARATPGVLPEGMPVESAIINQVTTVTHELIACFNAGELLRAYGLYTDAYLGRLLARQRGFDHAAYDFFATPALPSERGKTRLVSIAGVRLLDDGRVGASVVIAYPGLPSDKLFFFVYVEEDGRWLIDDIVGEITFEVP